MMRALRLLLAMLLLTGGAAQARDRLGVFGSWGAFRDMAPMRCFAVAEPARRSKRGDWRPFASVAHWPARGVRGQVHFRLRYRKAPDAPVFLSIDGRRFPLIAGQADAWPQDRRADAQVIAAMRSGRSMSIETRSATGMAYVDVYRLRGAASAADAAALACARLR